MQEVLVSKIFNYTSTPTKNVEGQFWFNPSTNVLSRFNGTIWKPITVSSDDVAVLTDGSKVSLTSYLNTQIAALAKGINSKQDKLLYYSETSGSPPSATILATTIKLDGKVVEGFTSRNTASGYYSHAEGTGTTASGMGSHTEGTGTTASGQFSHAEGYETSASSDYQHAQGKFNIEDVNDKYADIIGNGTATGARSNAATVSWDGISWSKSDVRAGGTNQDAAAHSLSAKQNATDNNLTTTDKTIVGAINELSADKQDTLQFYTESITDAPGYPSGSGIYKEQISLGKNNYSQTINIGGGNNLQNINLGGSAGTDGIITIGTTGNNNNQIQIGRDNTSTALEINAATLNGNAIDKTALTESSNKLPTSQAVLNELSSKQNATDNNLTTTDKTIVGAINELKTATDAMVVVSTDNAINVAPTTAQTGVLIASSKTNGGNVIITPKITNTGACYLSTSSTYSNLNPIYPDPTNNKYTYPNLGTVYLFVDNAGDSADIVIENFAG